MQFVTVNIVVINNINLKLLQVGLLIFSFNKNNIYTPFKVKFFIFISLYHVVFLNTEIRTHMMSLTA